MNKTSIKLTAAKVALLAEGVDRNESDVLNLTLVEPSPSSRRAWIEILPTLLSTVPLCVALLAEGVDRNPLKWN